MSGGKLKRAQAKRLDMTGEVVHTYNVWANSKAIYRDKGSLHFKWDLSTKGNAHEKRPVYLCDKCGALVAWFKSETTGKFFLCDVVHERSRWGRAGGTYSNWYFVHYSPHAKSCAGKQSTEKTDDQQTVASVRIPELVNALPAEQAREIKSAFMQRFGKLADLPTGRHEEALSWVVQMIKEEGAAQ